MAEGEQGEVIAFLSRGSSYGSSGEAPHRVDTHISHVFLTSDRVFKLKRAVRFSFVDATSLAARERFCRAELALNRRTAPALYRAVRAITRRPDGALEWDGKGPAVDFVVEMRRFDDKDLFDRMAREGRLDRALVVKLADAIAAFHAAAEPVPGFGGSASLRGVIADNHRYLSRAAPPLDPGAVDALLAASEAALERVGDLLDARQPAGKVRRCHGDLHLRNICLYDGEPTLFDCIEFSDEVARIDVLYDLAFLLMDLEHHGLRALGNAVFNRYLDRAPDEAGLAAFPLMLSIRAGVRAKVAVAGPSPSAAQAEEAAAYLALARDLLHAQPTRLIAVGGLSGSGKSSVAAGLAPDFTPAPGARLLRSDVVRKTLMGVAPEARLPAEAYSAEMNARVYAALRARAVTTLASGYTAIVDATFIDEAQRKDIEIAAGEIGVPFSGLWLAAPDSVLLQRVEARRGDASDADRAVLTRQLSAATGAISWARVDASGTLDQSTAAAATVLHSAGGEARLPID
jgi:uncharacterized protein